MHSLLPVSEAVVQLLCRRVGNQNSRAHLLGQTLHAARQIHRITHDPVLHARIRSDVARDHFAGVNANTNAERRLAMLQFVLIQIAWGAAVMGQSDQITKNCHHVKPKLTP